MFGSLGFWGGGRRRRRRRRHGWPATTVFYGRCWPWWWRRGKMRVAEQLWVLSVERERKWANEDFSFISVFKWPFRVGACPPRGFLLEGHAWVDFGQPGNPIWTSPCFLTVHCQSDLTHSFDQVRSVDLAVKSFAGGQQGWPGSAPPPFDFGPLNWAQRHFCYLNPLVILYSTQIWASLTIIPFSFIFCLFNYFSLLHFSYIHIKYILR